MIFEVELGVSESCELPELVRRDPWLEPYEGEIRERMERLEDRIEELGDLREFARSHEFFGLHQDGEEWVFREWAPRAEGVFLTGEFCGWSRSEFPLTKLEGGVWEVRLPVDTIGYGDPYKVHVEGKNGTYDRIPSHARRVVQDEETKDFAAEVCETEVYEWRHERPGKLVAPRIYEAHVGMATEKFQVGSYREFADEVLPRIVKGGYNAVQLMAVAEHPYYGSFGYHVANYFAPSSRCGTPEDLKYLVDEAHGLGLVVLMDVVHSHSVKNLAEGLSSFDGEEGLYFHEHEHPNWDSRLFDYGRREVCRFLLSNLVYWLEEFRFDGFRFDGVTSMMYHHHGNVAFDHYDKYFKEGVDWDAVIYLQLANRLVHEVLPEAVTVAEDMSGMPGLCRPLSEGGMGFDYRLAMGIPEYWIQLLKHVRDEDWDVGELAGTLMNRRAGERTIAYAESHDQALVGDKTIAFWLMDAAMYDHMVKGDDNVEVARGVAVHKLLRMLTMGLGGEGYLNFMGNEFGHPEWVDFPREGNDWSYQYARRQWSLVDNERLKYGELGAFDRELMRVGELVLEAGQVELLNVDQGNQCLQFERGGLVFAVNLSPERSIADYEFRVREEGQYEVVLCSDDLVFGGFGRVDRAVSYPTVDGKLRVYLPARTGMVFGRVAAE